MTRLIRINSCEDCPLNHSVSLSISSKRHIEMLENCVSIDESVESYVRNRTYHPECPLQIEE